MARKFVDLEEAAKMLGVTPDTLGEMRERREIFGLRDGANWKFKVEDVERVASDRAAAEKEGEFAEMDEDPDSILLSEVELGQSNESTSSTIIGGRNTAANPADSDIQLARTSDSSPAIESALDQEPKSGSSAVEGSGSGLSPLFDELDTLDLDMPSAADSGISSGIDMGVAPAAESTIGLAPDSSISPPAANPAVSDVKLASDSAMNLLPEGSGLAIGDEELALGSGSDAGLELPESGGSAIDLSEDMDDDLVLGGSAHGDLSRAGDSGISLLDPADSGISLESVPLELGGSGAESLELGEDDVAAEAEPAGKTVIKGAPAAEASEDDFLLTPLEDAAGEESDDSGSQVIALETDEVEFGEAPETAEGEEVGLGGLLEEDLGEGLGAAADLGTAPLTAAATGARPAAAAAPAMAAGGVLVAPEPAYSGWNVASLVVCTLLLLVCGMFTYDLMRSMWSWNEPYAVNSSMMNMILSWFEK
jgi:hypothetical protein